MWRRVAAQNETENVENGWGDSIKMEWDEVHFETNKYKWWEKRALIFSRHFRNVMDVLFVRFGFIWFAVFIGNVNVSCCKKKEEEVEKIIVVTIVGLFSHYKFCDFHLLCQRQEQQKEMWPQKQMSIKRAIQKEWKQFEYKRALNEWKANLKYPQCNNHEMR